jgi:hypothetical protein
MSRTFDNWFAVVTLAVGLLAQGCTAAHQGAMVRSTVSSLAATEAAKKRQYYLLPGNADTPANDLQYAEFAGIARLALQRAGHQEAPNLTEANELVFLSYGIGDPQVHQYSYSIPIWGPTGVASSTTYGSVSPTGRFSAQTYNTPTYGVTGTTTGTSAVVTYRRHARLDSFDADAFMTNKELVPLWRTEVVSTGQSGDLRRIFPVMVTAASDYIGIATKGQVLVELQEYEALTPEKLRAAEVAAAKPPARKEKKCVIHCALWSIEK